MKKIICALMLFFAISNGAHAALKVSPMVIELDANKARGNYITTAFNVSANKGETIRFKVYPAFFEITQEGRLKEIQKSDSKHSLVSNARFMPNEFTIKDGKTQKVRLTIANLNNLPEGENRMVLFLEDVAAKEINLPYHNKAIQTKLIVKTRVGVPVYVDKGRFQKEAKIESLAVKNSKEKYLVDMKILSTGNSKVRFQGKAQIINNKDLIEEFKLDSSVVRADGILNVSQFIPHGKLSKSGSYKLRVVLSYKDENGKNKITKKETEFTVSDINNLEI